MLLSALFNVDHKEAVSGLKVSVPPSDKDCVWSMVLPHLARQNPG